MKSGDGEIQEKFCSRLCWKGRDGKLSINYGVRKKVGRITKKYFGSQGTLGSGGAVRSGCSGKCKNGIRLAMAGFSSVSCYHISFSKLTYYTDFYRMQSIHGKEDTCEYIGVTVLSQMSVL